MISITLNGDPESIQDDATVHDLLERLELTGKRIAVEVNREIIPRSLHLTTALKDGDQVEIVNAIGGG